VGLDQSGCKDEMREILCLCLRELVDYPEQFCAILDGFPFRDFRKSVAYVFRVISGIPLDRLNKDEARCVCLGLARMITDTPCNKRRVGVADEEVVALFRQLAGRLQMSVAHFQMCSIEEVRLRRISGLE
jgi:hypothetical protein